jgi:hypothetical protein
VLQVIRVTNDSLSPPLGLAETYRRRHFVRSVVSKARTNEPLPACLLDDHTVSSDSARFYGKPWVSEGNPDRDKRSK